MKTAIQDIVRGLKTPFRAAGFIRKHPRLWGFALMPALMSAIFLGLLLYGASAWTSEFLELFALEETQNAGAQADTFSAAFGGEILRTIGRFLVKMLLFFTAGILAILLGKIAAAPFNEALSQRVDLLYSGKEPPKIEGSTIVAVIKSSWWAVIWEAKKVVFYLLVLSFLFILNLLPLVGSLAYASLGFLFNVGFMAFDYMDFPLERRPGPNGPLGLRERLRLLSGHKWSMLGFGAATSAMLFIPFINFLFLPLAVSGATLLYSDLERAGVETP